MVSSTFDLKTNKLSDYYRLNYGSMMFCRNKNSFVDLDLNNIRFVYFVVLLSKIQNKNL